MICLFLPDFISIFNKFFLNKKFLKFRIIKSRSYINGLNNDDLIEIDINMGKKHNINRQKEEIVNNK